MPLDWLTRNRRPEPAPPVFTPDWRSMKRAMEANVDRVNDQLSAFAPKPRDLDDLFAMGLRIAEDVIRWEEAAGGQSITVLIEHIKGTRKLRDTIEQGANGKEERAA